MSDNFDDKSDKNTTIAYPTREEIENIINIAFPTREEMQNMINSALSNYSKSISQSIQDRVISKLAKSAVTFLIGIIVTVFVIFKVLDNAIVTTKENIELKAQVEKLQLDLNTQKQKMNSLNGKIKK